ncbi:NAD-dependent epimerase/dehydratase family protein, partial [Candidatus Uhrbacteria bacterium]|nr:NAD-dependent epimerase/dehydratase family protein [Candidatus Uhrbacteria bacterium]
MLKKALVTGGAGFAGSHVVDALIKRGCSVTVVDDLSTGERRNVHPRAKLVVLDIRKRRRLEELVLKMRPDVIFHFAANIDPRLSVQDPE